MVPDEWSDIFNVSVNGTFAVQQQLTAQLATFGAGEVEVRLDLFHQQFRPQMMLIYQPEHHTGYRVSCSLNLNLVHNCEDLTECSVYQFLTIGRKCNLDGW